MPALKNRRATTAGQIASPGLNLGKDCCKVSSGFLGWRTPKGSEMKRFTFDLEQVIRSLPTVETTRSFSNGEEVRLITVKGPLLTIPIEVKTAASASPIDVGGNVSLSRAGFIHKAFLAGPMGRFSFSVGVAPQMDKSEDAEPTVYE
jgi:hypothetical protein